jgi:hypothetical protein
MEEIPSVPVPICRSILPGKPLSQCDLDKRRLPRSSAFFIFPSPQENHRRGSEINPKNRGLHPALFEAQNEIK